MAAHKELLTPHLVVDSVAFIKRARLETFGSQLYTCPQVLSEIRDAHTREFLKCLPYILRVEVPSKESMDFVSGIAKRTGDFSVLSKTDLTLIALTYELHKRYVGEPQLKSVEPIPDNLSLQSAGANRDDQPEDESSNSTESGDETELVNRDFPVFPSDNEWISEENFAVKALSNFGLDPTWKGQSRDSLNNPTPIVACLTTDFALQNVLFHTGLSIVSLDGLQIKEPRTFLLWCGSCFRPTKRTDTYFCPSCAQANLRRIPVTLHEDGHLEFHFSRHFVKRLRGSKQPIQHIKGGKYADDPIYCPDQRLPDRRPARPKHPNVQPIATNGLLELEDSELAEGLDCLSGFDNGFLAFPLHDVTSRSARMGIRSDCQIPKKTWHQPMVEHGLKPTRGSAHISKSRTGNKKKKRAY